MTCQEVMDLMQRYLDKDLHDNENSALIEHLSDCSNCTAIFERMKLLSNELTLLPKVEPAYSLVDKILPQLEVLEHERSTVDQNAASGSTPMLAWGKRISKSGYAKAIGIAAAAAIVLLIIFQNGMPSTFQTANEMASSGSANNSMNDSAPMSANHDGTELKIMMKSDDTFVTNDTMGMMNNEADSEPSDQYGDSFESPTEGQSTSDSSDHGVDSGEPESVEEEPMESMYSESSQESATDPAEYPPAIDPNAEQYPSPDREYIAYVQQDGKQLEIWIMNQENEVIHTTLIEEVDKIFNIEWTNNSKFLQYEVIAGDTVSFTEISVEPRE